MVPVSAACCRAVLLLRRVQQTLLDLLAKTNGSSLPAAASGSGSSRLSGPGNVSTRASGERRRLLCEATKQLAELLWFRQQNPTAAAAVCAEAVQHNAADVDLHVLRCRVALQLGDLEAAEQAVKELRVLNPHSSAGRTPVLSLRAKA